MSQVKRKKFKDTTKSLFLRYTLIPIFVIVILFFIFTLFVFNIKNVHDTQKSAINVEEKISNIYAIYANEIERMIKLPEVKEVINNRSKNHLIYEEFYNFNNKQEVKSAFHFIDNQNILLASTTPSDNDINNTIINTLIPQIEKSPNELYMDVSKITFPNGKVSVFNIGKAIVGKNEQIEGYIIYQLYEEDLEHLIFGEKSDIVVVTDYYDYILASTNPIISGLMNKFSPKKTSASHIKIKDDKYYMRSVQTPNKLFTIYTLKNTKNDPLIYWLYLIFIVLIGVILYILIKNSAEKMASKNVKTIESLMKSVAQLEKGDMQAYVTIDTGDEFEVLANQYNTMLDNLNELLTRNEELSNIRKMKEIKLLESQFNPHFLFNVLETLRYTLYLDTDKAQDIIFSLSRLLRYSLSIGDTDHEVSFNKDLDYIIDYLKLHKFRFGDRLEYQIDVQKEVESIRVPKLLLQPLIENAIKYGYSDQSHLFITLTGRIENNMVVFRVKDNGSGIKEEKLDKVQQTLYGKENREEIGIGLYNTHRRIVLQYGEAYGVTINSVEKKGTEVKVTIPDNKGAIEDV